MVVASSILISLTSFIGKIGLLEVVLMTLLYNFGWAMCFMASTTIYKKFATYSIMDGYGTNYVYVFSACFGLMVSLMLNCKQPAKFRLVGVISSVFISMIGNGFVFAAFPFTGVIFQPELTGSHVSILRNNFGPLNIYFSMTASVILTHATSAIFGRGKIGARETLLGTISGGITISVVADTIPNIGACIAVGAFSGFVSGLWMRVVYPRINRLHNVDHLGLYGCILINAVLGGFVLSPAYYNTQFISGRTPSNLSTGITTA